MLSHSFDRFYVAVKFALPIIKDLKFSPIEFDLNCSYLDADINRSKFLTQYIPNIRNFCKKIVPFIYFYKEQIGYCTLNSIYNEVTFNEKSVITKENLCAKYFPFAYKYIALNEKPPITKENLHIFFFITGRVECNQTAHEILTKEISLILPTFPKDRKEKRGIISSLVTSFISLAHEAVSSYLHNKRQKALHKAFLA